jgi:hypothetical protein
MTDPTPIGTVRELDCRTNDSIDVRLLWDSRISRVFVSVHDRRLDEFLEFDVAPADALEAFRHPYAYAHRVHSADPLAA